MNIIPRAQWGARPTKLSPADWSNVRLWCHHTVGVNPTPSASPEYEARVVRDIQTFHIFTRGWADIGYSYLVAPSGRVYEGRGFGKWGAHSPSVNGEPSVALLGDYSKVEPTQEQIAAVWALADELRVTDVLGHRDSYPTACPGDMAYKFIVADGRRGAKAPLPHGNTLRLALNGETYAGWDEVGNRLKWIARYELSPEATTAIAWRGAIWAGPVHVTNVAKHLVAKYLT